MPIKEGFTLFWILLLGAKILQSPLHNYVQELLKELSKGFCQTLNLVLPSGAQAIALGLYRVKCVRSLTCLVLSVGS